MRPLRTVSFITFPILDQVFGRVELLFPPCMILKTTKFKTLNLVRNDVAVFMTYLSEIVLKKFKFLREILEGNDTLDAPKIDEN